MLRRELDYFLSGLSFYTRTPCPRWVVYQPENLNKSRKYLPLIGLLVGMMGALVFWLSQLVLPFTVSVLLSMIATIYLTGAFHEDGFADSCDGFGGGWEKAQILTIMKDSRVGTYAVVGLILILALKFTVLLALAEQSAGTVMVALLGGHTLSRLMASLLMQRYDYVSQRDTSKSQHVVSLRLSAGEVCLSIVPVVLLLCVVWRIDFLVATLVMCLTTLLLGQYFQRRIGGYTGDCLGAVQQISEVMFYLSILVEI
ncbi:MAG: adenosylcobinamide-GDP ribazoletransferase [Proteobacteria bacterium]|nr:MAG: adenosylcobinamide-GDP ribazoletransferase [Pseudomonadota bacterium]